MHTGVEAHDQDYGGGMAGILRASRSQVTIETHLVRGPATADPRRNARTTDETFLSIPIHEIRGQDSQESVIGG